MKMELTPDRFAQQIKAGWRDEGLEEAVAIVSAMPEVNAVLERESALLAQNLVSGMASATDENEVAARANKATKEALCRSFLTGLQGSAEQITRYRKVLDQIVLLAGREHPPRALEDLVEIWSIARAALSAAGQPGVKP